MGRRYYCYYCNTSFPYSREGRKKHCSGHVHVRLRDHHYEQFESARQRYQTLLTKEKCRKFISAQGCNFGDECIYSHIHPQQLEELKVAAENEAMVEEYGPLPTQLTSTAQCPNSSEEADQLLLSLRKARFLKKHPGLLSSELKAQNLEASKYLQSSGERSSYNNLNQLDKAQTTDTKYEQSLGAIKLQFYDQDKLKIYEPLPPSLKPYTLEEVISQPIPQWGW